MLFLYFRCLDRKRVAIQMGRVRKREEGGRKKEVGRGKRQERKGKRKEKREKRTEKEGYLELRNGNSSGNSNSNRHRSPYNSHESLQGIVTTLLFLLL